MPVSVLGVQLVRAGFRRTASYRMAVLAGTTTNTVFGIIRLGILLSAAAAVGGSLAGYNPRELSTYAWLGQGMLAVVGLLGGTSARVDQRIRTGDIAIDLSRPVSPLLAWLADDAGRALQALGFRFAVPFAFGALVYGVVVPTRPETVPLFVLSAALAWGVSFAARVLVELAAFWTLDIRGLSAVYVAVSNVLCGLIVPLAVLPGVLRELAYLTPFPSMLQVPIDIALQRRVGWQALGWLAGQAAWLAGLLVVASWVLRRATRRVVIQGG